MSPSTNSSRPPSLSKAATKMRLRRQQESGEERRIRLERDRLRRRARRSQLSESERFNADRH